MQNQQIDILAFSPHPDDAEIGCGGMLILANLDRMTTGIIDLSAGEMSTRGNPELRITEKNKASSIIGLDHRECLGFHDTKIGEDAIHEEILIQCIRQLKPLIVLSPAPEEQHPDHEAASRIIKRAVYFANIKKRGIGPTHRTCKLIYYMIHVPVVPNFILDITRVWDRYMEAIRCYKSQFSQLYENSDEQITRLSGSAFIESLENRSKYFGAMINSAYGQPFYTSEPLAVFSPRELVREPEAKTSYGMFR